MNTSGVRFGTLIAADGTTRDESAPYSMSRSNDRSSSSRSRCACHPLNPADPPMPCHRFWKKPPLSPAAGAVTWWAWFPTSDGWAGAGDAVFIPHGSNAGESGSSLGSESSLRVDLPFDNRFFASAKAVPGEAAGVDFFFDGGAATVVGTTTHSDTPLPPAPLPPLLSPLLFSAALLRPDPLDDALRLPPDRTATPDRTAPPRAPTRLFPFTGSRLPVFVSAACWVPWVREPLETPCTEPSPEPPLLPPLLALSLGSRLSVACARSSFLRWRTAVHVLFLPLKASTPCRA
mmetsp:Transcript_1242/g.4638  ORF Transcript_1242/g.4638 Transcript_1242/m.4638 type:complete len:290 (+) Transcript_1242:3606-4475(+)